MVAGLARKVFHLRDGLNRGLPTSKRDRDTNTAVLNPRMAIQTNPQHVELVGLLDRLGIPVERKPWHMIYLTDPVALPGKLGLENMHVTEIDGGFNVESGGRTEVFSRLQLTKLFFGPEKISGIVPPSLPVPIYTPNTDHV